MKKLFTVVVFLYVFGTQAGDIQAGKAMSGVCAACHGSNGIAVVPTYPNLAGQKESYLINQLTAFKQGKRTDSTMQPMTVPLSKEDIANLAAYYSSLPADGKKESVKCD
ncbi:MAG: cytochrome C [Gammaproteobacteria bacterium]|nr:MAG: cytochrome C [Gammaproteobacteria bacterium]